MSVLPRRCDLLLPLEPADLLRVRPVLTILDLVTFLLTSLFHEAAQDQEIHRGDQADS